MSKEKAQPEVITLKKDGTWEQSVPLPYYRVPAFLHYYKVMCWECKEKFRNEKWYNWHYKIRHIMKYEGGYITMTTSPEDNPPTTGN